MSKTAQTIPVKVAWVGDAKTNEYGESRSVLCIHVDAPDKDAPDDQKFWLRYKPEEYGSIPAKGSRVQIFEAGRSKAGKPYYNVLSTESPPNGQQPTASGQSTGGQKSQQQAAQRLSLEDLPPIWWKLYHANCECYEGFGQLPLETAASIVTTQFIQADRHGLIKPPEPTIADKTRAWLKQKPDPRQLSKTLDSLNEKQKQHEITAQEWDELATEIFEAMEAHFEAPDIAAVDVTRIKEAFKKYADDLPDAQQKHFANAFGLAGEPEIDEGPF